jgi:hypothetical protein
MFVVQTVRAVPELRVIGILDRQQGRLHALSVIAAPLTHICTGEDLGQ